MITFSDGVRLFFKQRTRLIQQRETMKANANKFLSVWQHERKVPSLELLQENVHMKEDLAAS